MVAIDENACEIFGELSAEMRRREEAIADIHFQRVPGLKALSLIVLLGICHDH